MAALPQNITLSVACGTSPWGFVGQPDARLREQGLLQTSPQERVTATSLLEPLREGLKQQPSRPSEQGLEACPSSPPDDIAQVGSQGNQRTRQVGVPQLDGACQTRWQCSKGRVRVTIFTVTDWPDVVGSLRSSNMRISDWWIRLAAHLSVILPLVYMCICLLQLESECGPSGADSSW